MSSYLPSLIVYRITRQVMVGVAMMLSASSNGLSPVQLDWVLLRRRMGDNRLVHNVKWVNSIYALVRISFGESCSLETLPIDRSVHLQCPRDVGRVTSIKTGLSVNRIAFNICKYPSTILPQPRPNTTLLEDANELLNYTIPNFVEPSLMLCQRWLNLKF